MSKIITLEWQINNEDNHLTLKELITILDKYQEFLKKEKAQGKIIIISDNNYSLMLKLIKEITKREIPYALHLNLLSLTEDDITKIAKLNLEYLEFDLNGYKKTIGKEDYKDLCNTLKLLNKYNINTRMLFNVHKKNYKDFPKIIKLAKKYKIDSLTTERYIPKNNQEQELIMNDIDSNAWFKILEKCNKKHDIISLNKSLQFIDDKCQYKCHAGNDLIAIQANGDVTPCHNLPIYLGNILGEKLEEVYYHPILEDLRQATIPRECSKCHHNEDCRGGLKCLTYALTKSYKLKDRNCKR